MKKPSFYRGVSFMMLSAAGMSLVGLFGKWGIQDLTIYALMFWRYIAALTLYLLSLALLGKLKGLFHFRHLKLEALRTFFVLLAQYCFFYYLLRNNLLNASALLNTGPVFISLIEWGILRKKVGVSSWAAAFISFIGALCILQPDAGIFSLVSLIGLLSGASQGASQVVFGFQSEKAQKPHIGVFHLFILCAFFSGVPFLVSTGKALPFQSFSSWDFFLIAGLGAASIGNQIFRAEAYAHGSPSKLSPYLYLAVLLAGVWDWAFFGLIPNWLTILGAILIVLGGLAKIYLRNWVLKRREEK